MELILDWFCQFVCLSQSHPCHYVKNEAKSHTDAPCWMEKWLFSALRMRTTNHYTRVFCRLKFVHYRQEDKKKKWSLRTTNRNTSLPIRSYWMICIDPRRSFRVSFWHRRMMNISKKTQPVQMVTVTNEQESTWTLSGSVVVDAARRSQMDTFKVIWQYHSTMKN